LLPKRKQVQLEGRSLPPGTGYLVCRTFPIVQAVEDCKVMYAKLTNHLHPSSVKGSTTSTNADERKTQPQAAHSTQPISGDSIMSTSNPAAPFPAFDINALRLPASYGATLGVKRVLNNVPVGKPKKAQFFRVHPSPDMTFNTMLLEQKDTRESYLVMPDASSQISELVKPVQLFLGIDRQGNLFLVPIPLPAEDGNRNPWHESLAQAVELAKSKWLRIAANLSGGAYDVFEAQADLPEPEWPEYGMDKYIEVAFRGKIIKDMEHPVIQSLLGKV